MVDPAGAERAVLGAILLNNSILSQGALLQPEDFEDHRHRLIFRAIVDIVKSGSTADIITLPAALDGQLRKVGGLAYITDLTTGLEQVGAVADWVRIVRE